MSLQNVSLFRRVLPPPAPPPLIAWLQYNILWLINTFGYLTRERLFSINYYSWWGAVVLYRTQIPVTYILESNFIKVTTRDRLWGPRSLSFNEYWRLLQRGWKWPRREAKHLPLSSAEIKIKCSCTSSPLFASVSYTGTALHLLCVIWH
jgi:hypothetical protein